MARHYVLGKRKPERPQAPTPQRQAKAGGYIEVIQSDTAGRACYLSHDSSLLDRLHFDGFLGDGQAATWRLDAGNRLRHIHQAAGLAAPGAAELGRAQDGTSAGPREWSEFQSRAFGLFGRIMTKLGPDAGPAVRSICCYDEWPRGLYPSGLIQALDRLGESLD